MKGLFGIGSKLKDKVQAQRFEYVITIHNLQPWPESGNRAVAVGWQRGKRKRGATRSVYASSAPGKLGNVVRFNEKFELNATLYKAPTGTSNASQLGPFKKKCLILAVLETDGRTHATAALGRVVIDLAEFAAVDKQETRAFMVSCNKQIHGAVGDPQLLITIRTRWKKSSATVGGGDYGDDGGSMSTDTTGSRMTANLSSFLRYKYTGKGPATADSEQDLQGFDSKPLNSVQLPSSVGMGAIEEGEDGDGEVPESPGVPVMPAHRGGQQRVSPQLSSVGPTARALPSQRSGDSPGAYDQYPSPGVNGSLTNSGSNLRSRYGTSPGMGPGGAAAAALPPMGGSAGRMTAPQMMQQPYGMNGNYSPAASPYEDSMASSAPSRGVLGLQASGSVSSDGMQQELVLVAASELGVHLARVAAANSRRPERAAHAAARRLARTLVCLGPAHAPSFGTYLLRLVAGQLDSSSGDLGTLAFWWSNLAHLRGLLHGGTLGDALGPQVARLERMAFDHVVNYLWEEVLLPVVVGDPSSGASKPGGGASAASKRAQQEAAIKKWFEGLRQVNRLLSKLQVVKGSALAGLGGSGSFGHGAANGGAAAAAGGGTLGHVALLRYQALLQLLKRIDALLFYHLLSPGSSNAADLMSDYDPSGNIWGGAGRTPPHLDDAALPFTRGLLTFGSGMSVKMTVTRLQQWATSEGNLTEESGEAPAYNGAGGGGGGGNNQSSLFGLLRAAADLLMMPKELLMEATIRRDVCQALSIRTMLHMLGAFQPDEYAMDAIAPDILSMLRDEQLKWAGGRPALTDLSVSYRPPPEEQLLTRVQLGAEPGLDFDAESEDELAGVVAGVGTPGASSRFRLLQELWANNLGRLRGTVSVSSGSHSQGGGGMWR